MCNNVGQQCTAHNHPEGYSRSRESLRTFSFAAQRLARRVTFIWFHSIVREWIIVMPWHWIRPSPDTHNAETAREIAIGAQRICFPHFDDYGTRP